MLSISVGSPVVETEWLGDQHTNCRLRSPLVTLQTSCMRCCTRDERYVIEIETEIETGMKQKREKTKTDEQDRTAMATIGEGLSLETNNDCSLSIESLRIRASESPDLCDVFPWTVHIRAGRREPQGGLLVVIEIIYVVGIVDAVSWVHSDIHEFSSTCRSGTCQIISSIRYHLISCTRVVIVRFVINLVYPDCFFVPLISVLFSCQLLHLDPVITTSGITYERDSLRNHFRRIGYFDPLTRRPCTEEALIPNLSLKEAIEDFIIKNGWAADY
ncbi:hypothetical protein BC936DRAFT_144953 [Jimgerdemannia flammicorona]|uniref:RING-type E3 ubiquitin transferase n=1 Tax=Jimgerdemannia flammicorona TaxID=994334 RepID=A0A433DBA6_9FUNG|nr:hypothetical protein BC936DRAFT_144953 [Jimgerdemannia flammicorona]